MKVGITISLHQNSIWASGVNQNAIYLALVLKKGGHEVSLITSKERNTGSAKDVIKLCELYNLKYIEALEGTKKYFNVIIDLGFWLSNNEAGLFKAKNPNLKIVQYNCGNNFLIETEHILFGNIPNRHVAFTSSEYKDQPIQPDQIWMIPQMENISKDWYKFMAKTNKATVVPFVWEPIATENFCKEMGYGEYAKRPITKITTMESNISVMKHFLPTLITVEELLNRGVNIEKFLVVGADHLIKVPRVTQILRDKKLLIQNKISLNPRIPTQEMINKHADLILSWQWENNLNYLYLDAAWMGAPVVHNANLCPDVGYYYEGFQMYEAADVVEEAIKNHPTDDTYIQRNREVIKRYTNQNDKMVEQYNELLENLVNDKFVEMEYNWKDNSVSPK